MLVIILLILVIVIILYLVWNYTWLRKVKKRANELTDAVVNLERVTFDGAANNPTKRIAPGAPDPGHLPPPPPGF